MNDLKVIELDNDANLYMLIDQHGKSLATGTKAICEMLAKLAERPTGQPETRVREPKLNPGRTNVRSAIKI